MESTSCRGEGCLVLDIRLPGMTGLDLQEKLCSSGAKYPVIFMTAHDNPQWQERAKKVLRYLQIENKIRAALKYELAANIPAVQ